MRLLKISLLLLVVLSFISVGTQFFPLPAVIGQVNQLNPPPAPAGNPVTTAKANLGKALFWDEQLSSTKTVACGSCHHASNGGADPRNVTQAARSVLPGADGVFGTADDMLGSIGVPLAAANGDYQWSPSFGFKEQVTGRRSMSSINAAYASSLFWDGRASQVFRDPVTNEIILSSGAALENQILGPPVNSTEMGHVGRDWNDVAKRISTSKPLVLSPSVPAELTGWINSRSYPELFNEAFGASEVTPTKIAMAIATYERTLYSNQTPFDSGSLTVAETRGRQVFNQSECNDCHTGTLFTDNLFHNTGIRPFAEDQGLFVVTGNSNDLAKFRTPSLRNVELRAPYMHNGRFATLEEVVEFYNRGGDVNAANIERNRIRPLNLSAQQKADLLAFLKRPLTDPRVASEVTPFDRPMLYAESMRVPQIIGSGTAGTGGNVPQVMAISPPIVGNTNFTIGISNALSGAQAVLVIDKIDSGTTATIPASASLARVTTTLSSGGYSSVNLTIPNNPLLIGVPLYGRWYVNDPAAVGGIAVSQAFQINIFGTVTNSAPAIATVSAASYAIGAVAPESIVSGFGTNFSTSTAAATSLPLPETLAGVQISIRDVLGVERVAPLLYVSPSQINYQVPAGLVTGEGSVTVRQNGNIVASGLLQITSITPGLFAFEANGRGPAAAQAQRVKSDNAQSFEAVAAFDTAQNRAVTIPIDLNSDQVYLVLYGTGIRLRSSLTNVTASIGATSLPLTYAGAQGSFAGLDQANILLPRTMIGRGEVDVTLNVDGKISNVVRALVSGYKSIGLNCLENVLSEFCK